MVGFYGGEPMLHFPLMQHLISFGRETARKRGQDIRFGVTTNGTLLTKEALRCFEEESVDVTLSVDGDVATHDRFRKTITGEGTFAAIERILPVLLAYRPESIIRMTVNPQTVKDLSHNVQFLIGKGLRHLYPIPNIETEWSAGDWQTFDRECRKVANIYLQHRLAAKELTIGFLTEAFKHLRRGRRPGAACGAGKTLVSVAVDGSLYPCHRFVSNNNYAGSRKIGDVFSGIDETARAPFARYTSAHCLGCYSRCGECAGRDICGSGCLAKGDEINGNFLQPLRAEQYMNSILARIAKEVLAHLDATKTPAPATVASDVSALDVTRR